MITDKINRQGLLKMYHIKVNQSDTEEIINLLIGRSLPKIDNYLIWGNKDTEPIDQLSVHFIYNAF